MDTSSFILISLLFLLFHPSFGLSNGRQILSSGYYGGIELGPIATKAKDSQVESNKSGFYSALKAYYHLQKQTSSYDFGLSYASYSLSPDTDTEEILKEQQRREAIDETYIGLEERNVKGQVFSLDLRANYRLSRILSYGPGILIMLTDGTFGPVRQTSPIPHMLLSFSLSTLAFKNWDAEWVDKYNFTIYTDITVGERNILIASLQVLLGRETVARKSPPKRKRQLSRSKVVAQKNRPKTPPKESQPIVKSTEKISLYGRTQNNNLIDGGVVYFQKQSADINQKVSSYLIEISKALSQRSHLWNSLSLNVVSNDDLSHSANKKLSEARLIKVVQLLSGRGGVIKSKIDVENTHSRGPVMSGDSSPSDNKPMIKIIIFSKVKDNSLQQAIRRIKDKYMANGSL